MTSSFSEKGLIVGTGLLVLIILLSVGYVAAGIFFFPRILGDLFNDAGSLDLSDGEEIFLGFATFVAAAVLTLIWPLPMAKIQIRQAVG